MPPGHVPDADAGTEFVLFSRTDDLHATEDAIAEAMPAQREARRDSGARTR